MRIQSDAFSNQQEIPTQFTCEGDDTSPPLNWDAPPAGTKSLALIIDDPDAPRGVWTHWVVYNIPPSVRSLEQGSLPTEAEEGLNDWQTPDYRGPCPPSGRHHYHVKLYALDTLLEGVRDPTKAELLEAMNGHILEQTELVGTYRKHLRH